MLKICIYGVGGVGGFLGGKMASRLREENTPNYAVYFVARGRHLEEIKKNGLILNTPEQPGLACTPTLAAENYADLPVPDVIFICTKSYDLTEVVKRIAPRVTERTLIIPLLNGVDIYERIRENLAEGVVFPACVFATSHIEKPGTVTMKGKYFIALGKDPRLPDFVPEHLLTLLRYFGISHKWHDNPFPTIWEKYLLIAPFSLVTAWTGKTFGGVLADPKAKEKLQKIMEEVIRLAHEEGIDFRETIIPETIKKVENLPFETKTSFQRDVEQPGKKNELAIFGETIIRLGKKHGVPTPVTEELFGLLGKKTL